MAQNDSPKKIDYNLSDYGYTYKKNSSLHVKDTSNTSSGFSIFRLLVIIILSACVIRILTGFGTQISFTGFLEFLSDCPRIDLSVLKTFQDLTIQGSWGLFDFLRTFLNLFMQFFSVIAFVFSGIIQAIIFAIYFLRFLFA